MIIITMITIMYTGSIAITTIDRRYPKSAGGERCIRAPRRSVVSAERTKCGKTGRIFCGRHRKRHSMRHKGYDLDRND
jgi:hypothetical protein